MKIEKTKNSGFVAIFLVISAMIMILLGSLGASVAAFGYNDSILRHEHRIEAKLNAESCVSIALLAFAHDYFYSAQGQGAPDFSCMIISASRNGSNIFISASSSLDGVTEFVSATANDNGRSISILP